MLDALIVAWILTWFNLDVTLIDAINQIFNTDFNTDVYWLAFFIIGLISSIINK